MARTCTLCAHPKRAEIDRAIVRGDSNRAIAGQFGTSRMAVQRHRAHLPAHLAQARAAQETARADDLLARVVALRERLERALTGARRPMDVAHLARETRETLRLLLELEGRLRAGAQVNIVLAQHPEWLALQERLIQALRPYPEARAAVLAALDE